MSEASFGVSVLIPFYSSHCTLHEIQLLQSALHSVIDQVYLGPMEIIVIDDGCKVPIANFQNELGSVFDRVILIRHEKNLGLVAALNTGLRAAVYPLIARLDADDRWYRGKIEAQLSEFAADTDLTLSATGMTRIGPSGKGIETHIRPASWGGIIEFYRCEGCPFPHGSVVARKDVFRVLGGYSYDNRVSHCEDYALWGIWIRFFKPSMIAKSYYEYLVSDAAVSAMHATQQRRASVVLRANFEKTGIGFDHQKNMVELANALGSSLFDAGVLSFMMWKHPRLVVIVPDSALRALGKILPDRQMIVEVRGGTSWSEIVERKTGQRPCALSIKKMATVRAVVI